MTRAFRKVIVTWFRTNRRRISRIATGIFVVGMMALLGTFAVRIDWAEVLEAITAYRLNVLLTAGALAALSYTVYSGFDVISKAYTEHNLPTAVTMMVGFISYAFSLNLGSAIGGAGLRLRLYSRMGLSKGTIMRVIGLSVTTNWLGYFLLAGLVFASGLMTLPAQWGLGSVALRIIGIAIIVLGLAYLYLCAKSQKRSWEIRGHVIELPVLRIALAQAGLAMLNWALMGAIVYVLLQQRVDYFVVLGLLLITAVAGAVVHVPAGLGVIESIFIASLSYSDSVSRYQILAALVVYRAIYYLMPLFLAGLCYLALESRLGAGAKQP